jgi:formylglycine-generating enzyme required for sulfatase activity
MVSSGNSGSSYRLAKAALFGAAVAVVIQPTAGLATSPAHPVPAATMAKIPAGSYVPLYTPPRGGAVSANRLRPRVRVAAFTMAVYPVTNAEYLEFVRAHPEWRRSRVKPLFADASYLRHWRGDLELGDRAPAGSPVVYVSWFAARAYLRSRGQRLPTVDEWEYAAAASETRRDASRDPAFLERLRRWYGRPTPDPLPPVGSTFRNTYGIRDLHGLVWEWTLDFNSALITGESRGDASLERSLYCGSGAAGAADFENYAAFMRYAFRSSLEARYTVANLGFRGVLAGREQTP